MSEAPPPPANGPRPTPWDLIFGDAFESGFAEVREQVTPVESASAARLFMTPAAGDLLREVVPREGGREAAAQTSALLFAAWRFWLHGRRVYRFDDALVARMLSEPVAASPTPPHPAGYIQLPRHAIWGRIAEDAAPEPLDGFFWSAPNPDEGEERLDLLFALGIRPGRPGLSVFDLSLDVREQLAQWADVNVRPDGADFANILPGGDLKGYRGILTGGEALKLAALCFARMADGAAEWRADASGTYVHDG